jgi:hypothetical protein
MEASGQLHAIAVLLLGTARVGIQGIGLRWTRRIYFVMWVIFVKTVLYFQFSEVRS